MKSLWILIFILMPNLALAQIEWGNSGEGYKVGDRIYVRDLYESNNHLDPYIGTSSLPRLSDQADRLEALKAFGVNTDMLLAKLIDAENLKSGLGQFLMLTIENYRWAFVPDLYLEKDDTPVIPNVERVPLAKRMKNTIRLNVKYFHDLSDVQKVALIIHEAVYAMVKPTGAPECQLTPCRQSVYEARAITAEIFSKNALCFGLGNCLDPYSLSILDIDWQATKNLAKNEMVITDGTGPYFAYDLRRDAESTFFGIMLKQIAKSYCLGAFEERNSTGSNESPLILLKMSRPSFEFVYREYLTTASSAVDPMQLAAGIKYQKPYCRAGLRVENLASCQKFLINQIKSWYGHEGDPGGSGAICVDVE